MSNSPTPSHGSQSLNSLGDKAAITLSTLCFIHCLALPLMMVLMPSVWLASLNDERFHQLLLFAVLPISLYALWRGYRQHQQGMVLSVVLLGLVLLAASALLGHDMLGEWGEKLLTVMGAVTVALGHWWNYRVRSH